MQPPAGKSLKYLSAMVLMVSRLARCSGGSTASQSSLAVPNNAIGFET